MPDVEICSLAAYDDAVLGATPKTAYCRDEPIREDRAHAYFRDGASRMPAVLPDVAAMRLSRRGIVFFVFALPRAIYHR